MEEARSMTTEVPSGDVDGIRNMRPTFYSLPFSVRLNFAIDDCFNSLETRDHRASDVAIATVVKLLESLVDSPSSDPTEAPIDALNVILAVVSSPYSDHKMVADALSLQLPKVVVKFSGLSPECRETAGAIIDSLVSVCSPRDMLSILCEALDVNTKKYGGPCYVELILIRISKVLIKIQRRPLEQIKEALPVIMNSVHIASSESDKEDIECCSELFHAAIHIGESIQEVCEDLGGRLKEELCAVLGLFALQLIALIWRSIIAQDLLVCNSIGKKMAEFLPFCGFSCIGLITGQDVNAIMARIDDKDNFLSSFSFAFTGATLSVLWSFISDEVAKAFDEHPNTIVKEMQDDQTKRWQALGMLRHVLIKIDIQCELMSHCIDFILAMMDECKLTESNDTEFFCYTSSLVSFVQGLQKVIIGAPSASLRKKSYDALKKVLSDIPITYRVDMLKALVMNSNSPSMTALLIDVVRMEALKGRNSSNLETVPRQIKVSPFWSHEILDFIGLVLKPPKGGPPSLPEESELVVSALNLYRFVLIAESSGGTNRTGVLSEISLRKAYSEWLLPLRTLASGILAEGIKKDGVDELADGIICALNPVQFVLHRCIELVEDYLQIPN